LWFNLIAFKIGPSIIIEIRAYFQQGTCPLPPDRYEKNHCQGNVRLFPENNLRHRELGKSGIQVAPVALGLWPIAGMTTLGTSDRDSIDTIRAALDCGINFFDTAYCYGANGESERLLGQAIGNQRDRSIIATKCGIRWAPDGSRINDASPARIRVEIEESLQRLNMEYVDLYYLHSGDGKTAIGDIAAELDSIRKSGKCKTVGVSNLSFADLQAFHQVCPVSVVQYKYNMLQRVMEEEILPWCQQNQVSTAIYWPLMKGLLAGKMRRDWKFDPADKRLQYPMFQSPQWEWNQMLLDRLETIAESMNFTIAQLVVAWTIQQPGITVALCGAKRDWQIRETAQAMEIELPADTIAEIDQAISERLKAESISN
jgi:aryl-alcohol dehydrogenase-like predicted oxidoreductase